MSVLRTTSLALLATLSLGSAVATASNETHERTPVLWGSDAQCGTTDADLVCGIVLDRSSQSTWHLPYGIKHEDTDVGEDEVSDSRRNQFFALCRQPAPALELPPNWVTAADVEAAGEVIVCTTPMEGEPEECGPLVDPASVDPEDVLETSTQWEGCWHRITADDARRPITCEMADMGVDWDVGGLPVGVYVVEGYTWEPALNKWSQRPGFVKVLDDPSSPAEDLPAAALMDLEGDGIIYTKETVEFTGCVDALEGSTLKAEWGILPNGPGQPDWNVFLDGKAVSSGPLELALEVPEEASGYFILIRVTVEDPMGRTWTAFGPRELGVLPGVDCEDVGIIVPPECEGETDEETDAGTDTDGDDGESGSDGSDGAGADQGGGCGCASGSPPDAAGWSLGLLALGWKRRRRWKR